MLPRAVLEIQIYVNSRRSHVDWYCDFVINNFSISHTLQAPNHIIPKFSKITAVARMELIRLYINAICMLKSTFLLGTLSNFSVAMVLYVFFSKNRVLVEFTIILVPRLLFLKGF